MIVLSLVVSRADMCVHRSVFHPYSFYSRGFGDVRIVHRLAQELAANRNSVGEKPAIVPVNDDSLRPLPGAAGTADDAVVVEEFSFATTARRARDHLPEESRTAYFSLVAPRGWRDGGAGSTTVAGGDGGGGDGGGGFGGTPPGGGAGMVWGRRWCRDGVGEM